MRIRDQAENSANHSYGRFSAFISYSHDDMAAAAKLQQKLERYRLPKKVAAGHLNSARTLGPIFRDRDDLAAGTSLSAAIRNAISRADCLIILCSPSAAKSRWIAAEIALFRELHPENPILPAIISGNPQEAFPAELLVDGNEPLAADFRAEADGPQLGFLKIVAGVAGVPLDALIQRDAQRKLRRVMAVTVFAIAAVIIMGAMTLFAFHARNEAARQRAAAEGLVEFMLTDLRETLRGVGRPDAMTVVNAEALEHYRAQGDLTSLPPESLERRARVILAMGEDDTVAGRPELAERQYLEAYRTTAALLELTPKSPNSIFGHAQSAFYVGQSALLRGDRPKALRHWNAYRDLAGQLAIVEPNSVRSQMELGYSEGNLCDLYSRDDGNLNVALRHCMAAIYHEKKALALEPANRKMKQDLANRYGWAANVKLRLGAFNDVLALRKTEAKLMRDLVQVDPRNVEYALRSSWAQLGIADAHIALKQYRAAEQTLQKSIADSSAVLAEGQGNLPVMETELRLWTLLARTQKLQGRDDIASMTEARRIRQKMEPLGPRFREAATKIWATYIGKER
jgi:tetratricopeptide (TPR) repeat protein